MKSVFYIPNGTSNLTPHFPAVNWSNVEEYYLEVLDGANNVIATTPINKPCKCEDSIAVHFLNYCGAYDVVTFLKPKIQHEDEASEYQKKVAHPLRKQDSVFERFNVKSNDIYEVRRKCLEEEMEWLQELTDSPKMFLEWEGTQGQASDFLPVVKVSGKFDKLKNDKEFDYDFIIQFKLGNEFSTIRN